MEAASRINHKWSSTEYGSPAWKRANLCEGCKLSIVGSQISAVGAEASLET